MMHSVVVQIDTDREVAPGGGGDRERQSLTSLKVYSSHRAHAGIHNGVTRGPGCIWVH
jgi:hypothetical protein